MPVYMRLPKQRGSTSKDAMPIGPHRTHTQPVNLRDLERAFDDGAEVTIEGLVEKGLVRSSRVDVKILGEGDLKKKLTVTAHAFSASAREKIESAGGRVTALRDGTGAPKQRTQKKAPETDATAAAETTAGAKGTVGEGGEDVDLTDAEATDRAAADDAGASGA